MTASSTPLPAADCVLDTSGLVCPLPIIKTADAMRTVPLGHVLQIISTDFGILEDMPAWCTSLRQEFLGIRTEQLDDDRIVYHAFVRRQV